jgi:Icc-related predicted phosphoesterase
LRIAAIGDFHCRTSSPEFIATLLDGVENDADVLILAGDLTDTGLPAEMEAVISQLKHISLPIMAVLGNHDHESDKAEDLEEMLRSADVCVLDGTLNEIDDVGFVGTKGFCGGFDNLFVQPFGERALKDFIQASIEESIRLENALAKLDCQHKVAVLHYAPIRETLEGEPLELYPFLGSSRLENALDRHGVDVIFHGHAHHGSDHGKTRADIPVFNVSRFVQSRSGGKAYCLYEI